MPSFTHLTGNSGVNNAARSSGTNFTLAATPTPGNLVTVFVLFTSNTATVCTLVDSNNNSYTVSPHSPNTTSDGANVPQIWCFYLLNAPANATSTLTVAWTGTDFVNQYWFADEFTVSGGSILFDNDATGFQGAVTTISSPTFTCTASNELVVAVGDCNGTLTAPTSGSTLGIWTGAGGGIVSNIIMAEYALSLSGANAVQFSINSSTAARAMAMGFYFVQDIINVTKRLNVVVQ